MSTVHLPNLLIFVIFCPEFVSLRSWKSPTHVIYHVISISENAADVNFSLFRLGLILYQWLILLGNGLGPVHRSTGPIEMLPCVQKLYKTGHVAAFQRVQCSCALNPSLSHPSLSEPRRLLYLKIHIECPLSWVLLLLVLLVPSSANVEGFGKC